ncbi:MAG: hypothetical protein GY939_24725 [Actinomycetia bacterium]|nr:hypothetical protein [Actinomycetes bacterium]
MGRGSVSDVARIEAKRLLLAWLANGGDDIHSLQRTAFELHVEHSTFPGDEFTRVALQALEMAKVDHHGPIAYETLLIDHLPEINFRGKENRKIRFAVMGVASLRGGLDPDVLDEVIYWNDDYWRYGLWASIALIRASAAKAGIPVADLARRLAHRLHLVLDVSDDD